MSFRVNTNVSAMNALRNVSAIGDLLARSINRLSTGLRINSAADDPAGLIIAQHFRAQIAGVNQAIRNSQDAINYVKTAEGALDEVSKLLNDARALAVASANTGVLSSAQLQANQSQLNSIVASITRIAQSTEFGTKKLLDGSAGISASVTDGALLTSLSIGGAFGGQALTANSSVVMTVTSASTRASLASRNFGVDDNAVVGPAAGPFTLNGVTIDVDSTETVAQLRDRINGYSSQTGVVATSDGAGTITFTSTRYGSGARIDLSDSTGSILAAPGYSSSVGVDGTATLQIGGVTALFTASRNRSDGLTFTDADGNSFHLTVAGNRTSVAGATVGQVTVGPAQFQIGANAGQTATLSLGNFAASQLGLGVLDGYSMANLDLVSSGGASAALSVIDKAIEQVGKARGDMGNFQRNVLESNMRSLGIAKENMTATLSSIEDIDVAEEMTNFTKLQILQQAGLSVLAQANSAPQAILALLRG